MSGQNSESRQRSFSLWLYLLIVFGLSWPFQIVAAIWGIDLLPRYVLHSASMCMVTVGTFIAGRYVFRDGFAGAGWQWGKPKQYIAVIGLALVLWVVPTIVDLFLGTLTLPPSLTGTQITWVFVLLFVTLIPGFGEEFGWRGYMLPRLAQRFSPRKAVLIHSVIWWAWHLPVLIGMGVWAGIAGAEEMEISTKLSVTVTVSAIVITSAIPGMLHGVVFAYIWTRSRSLAVPTVYHAAYDGLRDSLQVTIGTGPVAGIWAVAVLIILGIIFLWKGNWQNLQTCAKKQQVETLQRQD